MKANNLIKKVLFVLLLIAVIFTTFTQVLATESSASNENTQISLSDDEITVNGEAITENTNDSIYLSHKMNNGGESEEALEANIDIGNIVTIKESGTYEFTGKLTDGQIAVDTNSINGDVTILLNNVNIKCENAPAIFVYNVKTKLDYEIIIKTAKDSENYISGGLIKQSVEGWADQDKIVYSIEKGTNDEGEYFERYKYDAAISSDVSLTFEGEGSLTIESQREGIESKRDITINSGNYTINSTEDGMNACQDNESVITINGGTILVNVDPNGTEGDGIDSNGSIYINDGEIYTFSNGVSEDSGLDSDLGIYINGGRIVAIGNMYDEIKDDTEQNSVTLQFNDKIEKGTLIVLSDENDSPVIAFETDRNYKVITFSDETLKDINYTVYKGGTIDGTKVNGLYTNITSYTGGTQTEANILDENSSFKGPKMDFEDRMQNEINWQLIEILGVTGAVCLILAIVLIIKKKSNVVILILGIVIGAIISFIGISIYQNNNMQNEFPKNMKSGSMEMPEDFGGQREQAPDNIDKNQENPPDKL